MKIKLEKKKNQQNIAEVDLTFLIKVALKQSESKNLQPKK